MAKDLIAKYGAGHGIRESELRKSLRVRNIVWGGIGVVVLGILYGSFLIHPMAPFLLIGCAVGVAVVFFGFEAIEWLSDEMPDHLANIRKAKESGVIDDG